MNRYTIVCRLRWPAFLLLTGIIALLDQMDLVSWGRAWPLYLILWGVLALAERAAMAGQPPIPAYDPMTGYPAGYAPGYAPQSGPYTGPAASTNPVQPGPAYQPVTPQPASTSIVPAATDLEISASEAARQSRKTWEEEGR
jgi:hypothetical protein